MDGTGRKAFPFGSFGNFSEANCESSRKYRYTIAVEIAILFEMDNHKLKSTIGR